MRTRRHRLGILVLGALLWISLGTIASAARVAPMASTVPTMPGIFITPATVDAGHWVQLLVIGPVPAHTASVVVTFRSAHHAWSAAARWADGCGCYAENVYILPRTHGLERAAVTARVALKNGGVTVYHAAFFIRGLATAPDPVAAVRIVLRANGANGHAGLNPCSGSAIVAMFSVPGCPLTPRLRARLATNPTSGPGGGADPMCRCQNVTSRSVYVVLQNNGATARVEARLFFGASAVNLTFALIDAGGRWLVDDTYCFGRPATSIYHSPVGPC